ncbi:MAG: alpha-amylase/4-alpha-glucanotransferase domain-containing protein, partial [Fidelibacterota bacterium]
GYKDEALLGYFITEEQNRTLSVFPISQKLRYLIPFSDPEKTIEYIKSFPSDSGGELMVITDDGEKFGLWPGTHNLVFVERWLERFFTILIENSEWLNITTFSEYIDKFPPLGRIYLPTNSYFEMGEWSLPPESREEMENFVEQLEMRGELEEVKRFLRGGFWRNFLVKYPESNHMQKRMYYISEKLREFQKETGQTLSKEKFDLMRGQCNCAYWHGIFGGLYLPHLRNAVYQNLISAESSLDKRRYGPKGWILVEKTDFDKDGVEEIILKNSEISVFISPGEAGAITEIDYKPANLNLMNTMARRRESYHKDFYNSEKGVEGSGISIHNRSRKADDGLRQLLYYDTYRKMSLIDHFFDPDTTLEEFIKNNFQEFILLRDRLYSSSVKRDQEKASAVLSASGSVRLPGVKAEMQIIKRISITCDRPEIEIEIQIKNLSEREFNFNYGSEFNFFLASTHGGESGVEINNSEVEFNPLITSIMKEAVRELTLKNGERKISIVLNFEGEPHIWYFPVETVSQSESQYERIYQSSTILPYWNIRLESSHMWETRINLKISASQ